MKNNIKYIIKKENIYFFIIYYNILCFILLSWCIVFHFDKTVFVYTISLFLVKYLIKIQKFPYLNEKFINFFFLFFIYFCYYNNEKFILWNKILKFMFTMYITIVN